MARSSDTSAPLTVAAEVGARPVDLTRVVQSLTSSSDRRSKPPLEYAPREASTDGSPFSWVSGAVRGVRSRVAATRSNYAARQLGELEIVVGGARLKLAGAHDQFDLAGEYLCSQDAEDPLGNHGGRTIARTALFEFMPVDPDGNPMLHVSDDGPNNGLSLQIRDRVPTDLDRSRRSLKPSESCDSIRQLVLVPNSDGMAPVGSSANPVSATLRQMDQFVKWFGVDEVAIVPRRADDVMDVCRRGVGAGVAAELSDQSKYELAEMMIEDFQQVVAAAIVEGYAEVNLADYFPPGTGNIDAGSPIDPDSAESKRLNFLGEVAEWMAVQLNNELMANQIANPRWPGGKVPPIVRYDRETGRLMPSIELGSEFAVGRDNPTMALRDALVSLPTRSFLGLEYMARSDDTPLGIKIDVGRVVANFAVEEAKGHGRPLMIRSESLPVNPSGDELLFDPNRAAEMSSRLRQGKPPPPVLTDASRAQGLSSDGGNYPARSDLRRLERAHPWVARRSLGWSGVAAILGSVGASAIDDRFFGGNLRFQGIKAENFVWPPLGSLVLLAILRARAPFKKAGVDYKNRGAAKEAVVAARQDPYYGSRYGPTEPMNETQRAQRDQYNADQDLQTDVGDASTWNDGI